MSLINISGLTFSYDGSYDNIFENVSFQIDTDWKLGFTGRNGRGKTTFLNLLMGKYEYSGSISATVSFDYFPFKVNGISENSLDIANTICPNLNLWELVKELSLLDVSEEILYRPFSTLSNGERTKLLLCLLFLKDNNFLLIDEPTNHLDTHARQVVAKYLQSKKSFILVSHDREFLDNCVDHILSINKENIEIQSGNFSSWFYNKTLQDNFEQASNERLKKDITRLTKASRQTARWSDAVEATKLSSGDRGHVGHMAAKMMKRSKSTQKRRDRAVEEKSKLLKNIETSEPLAIKPLDYHTTTLIRAFGLSVYYGDKAIARDINLTIDRGDRAALIGKNGSGKTSIIKLILGDNIAKTGELHIGSGLVISYVSQDTSFLSGSLNKFIEQNNIDETLFKAILRKLDFSRAQFDKNMDDFSEGQKKKALIAQSLCKKAHLYIWDEPLNYIDVMSRMQIENLLITHKPTILFVEHDSAFVKAVATKIISL